MHGRSNDALRARGIIPALPPPPRSPSPEHVPTAADKLDTQDLSDDELLDLEDDLPASVLDAYREARLKEYSVRKGKGRFGHGLLEIGRDDYAREVTEASKQHIEGESGGGTGVVCFLHKDS